MPRRPADFSEAIKRDMATRAGHVCSYCQAPTSGPSSEPNGTVNLGEAGHITAASPGGPRYDLSLTDEQRSSAENGIWLCRTHAALVDRDDSEFTVEQLLRVRADQEARAHARLRGWPTADDRLQPQLDALAIHEIRRAEFALHTLEPQDFERGIETMLPFADSLRYGSDVGLAFLSVLYHLFSPNERCPVSCYLPQLSSAT